MGKQFGAIISALILITLSVVVFILPVVTQRVAKKPIQLKPHQQAFATALVYAKGGFSLILLIVSFWYSIYYPLISKHYGTNTYFSTPKYRWRPLADAAITFIFVACSMVFIIKGRCGDILDTQNLLLIITISLILSIFVLAQETSGFNRFMARHETQRQEGNYYEIDQEVGTDDSNTNFQDDPFIDAFSMTLLIFFLWGILYAAYVMFTSAVAGYHSNQYNITSVSFFCQQNLSDMVKIWLFVMETIVVLVLNLTPPILSAKVRNETVKWHKILLFGIMLIVFHVMLQYNGFLKFPIF